MTPVCSFHSLDVWGAHLVPLAVDVLGRDGGVGVAASPVHVVGLHDLGDLVVDAQDGLALLVGLRQRGLELLVGRAQPLGFRAKEQRVKQAVGIRDNCTVITVFQR